MSLPLSRVRYGCPLDGCMWTLEPAVLAAVPRRYMVKMPAEGPPSLDETISEMAAREGDAIETALRAHWAEHDLLDFLHTINRLQQELAQHDSGIRPHDYARIEATLADQPLTSVVRSVSDQKFMVDPATGAVLLEGVPEL